MKTSELIGPALDWAVAKCEGYNPFVVDKNAAYYSPDHGSLVYALFSTNWSQGGPIIERELIRVISPTAKGINWVARIRCGMIGTVHEWLESYGPTPLIAAMRCLVASKLGDEVEIPEELK